MNNKRRSSIAAILLGFVVVLLLGVPPHASGSAQDSPRAALTPPPPPVDANGIALAGSWHGPYTFRNFNSGKCLDILGASTKDGAPAVQYTCAPFGRSQTWWLWQMPGGSQHSFNLFMNDYSGKCIMPYTGSRGAEVRQYPCYEYEIMTWANTINDPNLYYNYGTGFAMEVNGASKANFARVLQWTKHGRAHQIWLRYNA